jgi:predicted short-subunit dehydrogenase-like oxidoreductase (DUF2520 family)
MKNIVIIGSGNVAWQMAQHLPVKQIIVSEASKIQDVEMLFPSSVVTTITHIDRKADLYMLCVRDTDLETVISDLPFHLSHDQVIVHTSGACDIDILSSKAEHYGCIWPIQTITRGKLLTKAEMSVVVSANDNSIAERLTLLAESIADHVHIATPSDKAKLHLSAVMTNNFIHHLIVSTRQYCEDQGLPFDLLLPILKETIIKASLPDADQTQTGPARRGDNETIDHHLTLLEEYMFLKHIYTAHTVCIFHKYNAP